LVQKKGNICLLFTWNSWRGFAMCHVRENSTSVHATLPLA
jgi:hypothetical protein